MSEAALISLIALLGWLVLMSRSSAVRDMDSRRKLTVAAVWLAIFAGIAMIFSSVG